MSSKPVRLDDLISSVDARHPDGDALGRLSDAVASAGHLGEVADSLIGYFVDQARRAGASWTDIGAHMGVSKQAVQKRFVPRETDELDLPRTGRFSRFTKRARHVVEVAQAQAQQLGHDRVGNEHLVLGLLAEPDGLAGRAMARLAPSLDEVRAAVTATLPASGAKVRSARFSREAKKTLALALREALHQDHNYIGTEHLLLGLLRADDDPTAQVLNTLGITHDAVAEWVQHVLDSGHFV
jgi:hypothetical protein